MKHIKLFEQFVESVSESKKFSDAFAVLDFFGGALPNDYSKALTAARKAGHDLPTSLYYEAAELAQDGVNESINELALTSTGVKGLLHAIYYNWDTIKQQINAKLSLGSFRDVIQFVKSGDQEEQAELESFVKETGIKVLDLDDKSSWDLK